jgi:hypothetical protein
MLDRASINVCCCYLILLPAAFQRNGVYKGKILKAIQKQNQNSGWFNIEFEKEVSRLFIA